MNFSRAIRDRDMVFVSNTSGMNYETGVLPPDVGAQARQMLVNIEQALAAVAAKPSDIVSAMVFVPDRQDLAKIADLLSEAWRETKPTVTVLCVPLASEELKIEMQVTARLDLA